MNLPEIINTPITLKIGGVEIQAKKATLKDYALYEEYARSVKDEPQAVFKSMVYALQLCIQKAYPEEKDKITTDYLMELIPLDLLKDGLLDILVKLGFMSPPKPEAK